MLSVMNIREGINGALPPPPPPLPPAPPLAPSCEVIQGTRSLSVFHIRPYRVLVLIVECSSLLYIIILYCMTVLHHYVTPLCRHHSITSSYLMILFHHSGSSFYYIILLYHRWQKAAGDASKQAVKLQAEAKAAAAQSDAAQAAAMQAKHLATCLKMTTGHLQAAPSTGQVCCHHLSVIRLL